MVFSIPHLAVFFLVAVRKYRRGRPEEEEAEKKEEWHATVLKPFRRK